MLSFTQCLLQTTLTEQNLYSSASNYRVYAVELMSELKKVAVKLVPILSIKTANLNCTRLSAICKLQLDFKRQKEGKPAGVTIESLTKHPLEKYR